MSAVAQPREAIVWQRGFDLRDDTNHYNWKGRHYPSVTTVLEPITGEFMFVHFTEIEKLVNQLVEEGRKGAHHIRWQQVVDPDGVLAWQMADCHPSEALKDGKYVSYAGLRYLKACADRGTTCHDVLGGYASGEFLHATIKDIATWVGNRIEEERRSCTYEHAVPYALSLWRWLDKYRPKIWLSEAAVFSDEHEYAGSLDMAMLLGHSLLRADLKTNDSFKRAWMAQCSAYAHAEFAVVNREHAIEVEMPRLAGEPLECAILMVTPERAGLRAFDPVEPFQKLFLPALNAWRGNAGTVGIGLPPQAVWDKWPTGAGVEK